MTDKKEIPPFVPHPNGVCAGCGDPLYQYLDTDTGMPDPLYCWDCDTPAEIKKAHEDFLDRITP